MKKILPYKLSRLLPMLGLAGTTLTLPSCEKNPLPTPDPNPQKEISILFYEVQDPDNPTGPSKIWSYSFLEDTARIASLVRDPNIKTIYLEVADFNNYKHFSDVLIKTLRSWMEDIIYTAPSKIRGRGDFHFSPGVAPVPDSTVFHQLGWTVNQKPIAPIPDSIANKQNQKALSFARRMKQR